MFIDSFSGDAALLPRRKRTPDHVLAALRVNPRVSTWDMIENAWLVRCIKALEHSGKIIEDEAEPYPWHLFVIVDGAQGAAAQGANDGTR